MNYQMSEPWFTGPPTLMQLDYNETSRKNINALNNISSKRNTSEQVRKNTYAKHCFQHGFWTQIHLITMWFCHQCKSIIMMTRSIQMRRAALRSGLWLTCYILVLPSAMLHHPSPAATGPSCMWHFHGL